MLVSAPLKMLSVSVYTITVSVNAGLDILWREESV